MRILHTSDWHLGHLLRDIPREDEHRCFLDWLLGTIEARDVDALLVAGDVFHTANPPASAQKAWYDFLARARHRFPKLQIVVIGGNHDSAARLEAPGPLLDQLRIRVVGAVPRGADGGIDVERMLVPLTDKGGWRRAWVVAVPYLRAADLPRVEEGDALIEGVRKVYADAFAAARAKRRPGQALIGMGHCHMASSALSEQSERRILGGGLHALPADIFPADAAYVALGHLHLAQPVGREAVRYSGSPIPLSMGEAGYHHQVVLVDVEGEGVTAIEPIAIPRTVGMLRVPESGPLPLEDVLLRLRSLPRAREGEKPFLAVQVRIDRPEPGLRRRVEEAIEGRAVRLVQIDVVDAQLPKQGLGDVVGKPLQELDPVEVFVRKYRQKHPGAPSDEMMAAFGELLEAARSAEAPVRGAA